MPDDEDAFGLECVLGLYEVFGEEFSVVGYFSPHVVDKEGFGEVVSVVGERHSFEVKGHSCAAFEITELVLSDGSVHVSVEVLGNRCSVFREVCVITSCFPLLVEIHNVVGLGAEELAELFVLENLIEDIDFIDGGFHTLVSNTGQKCKSADGAVNFPDKSLTAHHESESRVCGKSARPSIV